jgi:hypothetical protein
MDRKSWWSAVVDLWKGTASDAGSRLNATPARLRLVIDTGVVAEAAREPASDSRLLLEAVAEGRTTMLISAAIFVEYRDRLPAAVRSPNDEQLVRSWIGRAEAVSHDGGPPGTSVDDEFISLAGLDLVDALVTNDESRFALARRHGVRVLHPRDAVASLQ